ncbi:MAG: hypothetical protein QME58_11135 [Bacteroidota bacterium]|nr:hypothetical protein [Bacteroidota bacterium]
MRNFKQIDITKVKTISIKLRKSKVTPEAFAKVYEPGKNSLQSFLGSFPNILAAKDLNLFVDIILQARKKNKPVIVLMGAHVIKVGLSPLIIDLIKNNIITAIGMNSAAAIHDVETAMFGNTSEDVAENILDGYFGMARETGELINVTLQRISTTSNIGYGEAIGRELIKRKAPNLKYSILASGIKLNVPVTVHAAIGTDIIHQQPTMDGAATGEMSFRDFKVLCNSVKDLVDGGVVINIGSAVIMPEVFLKTLTVTRNLGYKTAKFSTANFDMLPQYRPYMNIVTRPTQAGGKGFNFIGHHEIMIPLLYAMINERNKK